MSNTIHVDDIGVQFIVQILDDGSVLDLSTATSLSIVLRRPDNSALICPATLYTNGSDGKLQYISVDGDLSEAGIWKIQANVHFFTSFFHTSIDTFKVLSNL